MSAARPPSPSSRRLSLGSWPTPLEAAPRLGSALGFEPGRLWLKRDDLTGLGAGGNKVRKLEYLCASALEHGATVLVTSGASQSNHARLTAAAARRLGLECTVVLAGEAPALRSGNLLLEAILGARVVWAGSVGNAALADRVDEVAADLRSSGHTVEVIPLGGSNARGALGYVDCGRELDQQLPEMVHVIVALGTGGTMAGLVAALGPDRVLGVDVGAVEDPVPTVARLVGELGEAVDRKQLRVRSDQVGPGYGVLTAQATRAMSETARLEGVILDPVYTAKAMSGLFAALADGSIGPDDPTVFLHTGGLPGLFGHKVALEQGALG